MPTRTLIDRLLADHARTGALPAISGGDNDPPDPPTPPTDPPPPTPVTFTPEQQAELNRIVAREAKTARDKAIKAEQDRVKAAQDAAEAERQRKADEAKGEYEKVKTSLTNDLNAVKGEYEAAKAEYEAVKIYFETQYAAALKDLPDVIKAFAPGDDAGVSVKADWLSKATEQAKKLGTQTGRGNGGDPKPGGTSTVNEQDALSRIAARARL